MTEYSYKDYMDKKCDHRTYWAQFVTRGMVLLVKSVFGKELDKIALDLTNGKYPDRIVHGNNMKVTDALNTIKLSRWDRLKPSIIRSLDSAKWRRLACNTYVDSSGNKWNEQPENQKKIIFSLSDSVCLAKEAAKQIIEEQQSVGTGGTT